MVSFYSFYRFICFFKFLTFIPLLLIEIFLGFKFKTKEILIFNCFLLVFGPQI